MYNFKVENGKVKCLLRTGSNLVKNRMSVTGATSIVESNALTKSDIEGFDIHTENGWYFEGSIEEKTEKKPVTKRRK